MTSRARHSRKGTSRRSGDFQSDVNRDIEPAMDWQCGKSITECLDHLLSSNIASDVTFLLGENKEIVQAHKLILISRSPVFYAMLEGPMSEKGEITIPDITKETFCAFLKYLYTDNLALNISNAVPILAAARKYCVDRLVDECEKYIQSNLSATTTCIFLEDAHVFMEDNIKSRCLEYLHKNPSPSLKSDGFSQLCQTCVESITSCDDLSATEEAVFEAVKKWSEAECGRKNLEVTDKNQRIVLGNVLYTVRFPLLGEKYFNKNVLPSSLLNSDEIVMIYRHWHSTESLKSSKFITNKRNTCIGACESCGQCGYICCNSCGQSREDYTSSCLYCDSGSFQCDNCGFYP